MSNWYVSGKKKDSSSNSDVNWGQVYAGLLEHTSLTKNDINELSLPEIEDLIESINANNSESNGESNETLSGTSALEFLMANNGKI